MPMPTLHGHLKLRHWWHAFPHAFTMALNSFFVSSMNAAIGHLAAAILAEWNDEFTTVFGSIGPKLFVNVNNDSPFIL